MFFPQAVLTNFKNAFVKSLLFGSNCVLGIKLMWRYFNMHPNDKNFFFKNMPIPNQLSVPPV